MLIALHMRYVQQNECQSSGLLYGQHLRHADARTHASQRAVRLETRMTAGNPLRDSMAHVAPPKDVSLHPNPCRTTHRDNGELDTQITGVYQSPVEDCESEAYAEEARIVAPIAKYNSSERFMPDDKESGIW